MQCVIISVACIWLKDACTFAEVLVPEIKIQMYFYVDVYAILIRDKVCFGFEMMVVK